MSLLPYFIAKTFISLLSGHMLLRFCPGGHPTADRGGHASLLALARGDVVDPAPPSPLFGLVIAMIFKGWLTRGVKLDPVPEGAAAH